LLGGGKRRRPAPGAVRQERIDQPEVSANRSSASTELPALSWRTASCGNGQVPYAVAAGCLAEQSPDMVRQEIYGYLLTHYAISALICQGGHCGGDRPGPGQIQARRPHRAAPGGRPGFSPEQGKRVPARIMADITLRKNLNRRRHRSYPRVVK
jgi:hypothetical protein